ncbi:MAG: ATP-dependent sacrificial sulfur transferase LarE [Acidimicrobiia bacterium]|nr:ATP-dependent sacrificial sulfur transferase LarE [Acidimicrobiia bacterium]
MTPGRANLDVLRGRLRAYDGLVVAYSGGADSAFLATVAHQALRDRMVAVTAVSPSLAASERADAAAFAAEHGFRHVEVETDELERAAYRVNDGLRCAQCKDALMDALLPIADEHGAAVALGVNLDDLGDHRPGQAAASGRGAVFPLVDAGFTKADVRAASRRLGLRTWDKPAAPCLASRVPYGTPVDVELLSKIERAEAGLRDLGFRELRVRHGAADGGTARIEVPVRELAGVVEQRESVLAAVRSAGYRRVTLDLDGLRSGNLNDDL